MNNNTINGLLCMEKERQKIVDKLSNIKITENSLSHVATELCNLYCACEITLGVLNEEYASQNGGGQNVAISYLKDSVNNLRHAISTHLDSDLEADKQEVRANAEFGLKFMQRLTTLVNSLYTIQHGKFTWGGL